ncbi:Thioredoxin-like fold protein [Senna tora]|uniref:Thioredoxin-like fold protein n=1 Tax=Senna tora TaxID=362788 RepID=A0A834WWT4_9FABA|nr:Thioredoxin-like fold protein [Senna tora]
MWRPWGRSTLQIHHTSPSPSPSPSSSNFSCSSFKDIQTLCLDDDDELTKIPSKKPSIFHRVRLANSFIRACLEESPALSAAAAQPPSPPPSISAPGVVVYFTSLRVVRSTFEDCRAVRSILRGFRVRMDERDLSMDSGFVRELQGMMMKKKKKKELSSLSLPSVFIGGKYIGGAEEVRRLHESGELKKLMEGLPAADSALCDVCAGHRFVLCDHCDGSRKLYTAKGGFKTCTACNENGLTRY